jgi:hypothetical protein
MSLRLRQPPLNILKESLVDVLKPRRFLNARDNVTAIRKHLGWQETVTVCRGYYDNEVC